MAADGARIPNEGKIDVSFRTEENAQMTWEFQLANVNKALGSVSHMNDEDYYVAFNKHQGKDAPCAVHKPAQQVLKFRRDKGVFTIDAYLEDDHDVDNGRDPKRSHKTSRSTRRKANDDNKTSGPTSAVFSRRGS